ncbi:MAG: hypothetical protein BMS9Abin05_0491 [Rhodothermia bacterium]|nr:MAG: hypothetical protein BMS9Abin05_0491 [Rhodothermia bacterium]
MKVVYRTILAALLVWVLSSCAPSIAPFSQQAYQYATELKVETLSLMERAENSFADNLTHVEKLKMDLAKAYEFAKGRPRNEHSARQWEILIDPERNLIGGFLSRWESERQLSFPFIQQSQLLIADAFDTVIGLESGKVRFDD